VDASALVKLVIDERESAGLRRHLTSQPSLATNEIAVVEVLRAVKLADPSGAAASEASRMLDEATLVEIDATVLKLAAQVGPPELRTLDAIHLATALELGPDEFVAYDRRLLDAAALAGLSVSSPGA
jgi:hypothetical protein